jgi:hypothetical protein
MPYILANYHVGDNLLKFGLDAPRPAPRSASILHHAWIVELDMPITISQPMISRGCDGADGEADAEGAGT